MGENRGKLYALGGYSRSVEFYNNTRWSEVEGKSWGWDSTVTLSTPNGIYMAGGTTIYRFDNDEFVDMGHVIHVKKKF